MDDLVRDSVIDAFEALRRPLTESERLAIEEDAKVRVIAIMGSLPEVWAIKDAQRRHLSMMLLLIRCVEYREHQLDMCGPQLLREIAEKNEAIARERELLRERDLRNAKIAAIEKECSKLRKSMAMMRRNAARDTHGVGVRRQKTDSLPIHLL